MEERKGRIIGDFLELLDKNFKEEITKSNRKLSLEEVALLFEKQTDDVIREAIRNESLAFIGGKLFIKITSDLLAYEVGMEAYFQRTSGEWVIKKNRTRPRTIDDLLLDSRTELKRLSLIEFELTEPK